MVDYVRCHVCVGSGQIMGGGMMTQTCPECSGRGKFEKIDDELEYLAMKQSEGYKDAKKKLKEECNFLSDIDAEKLLDQAINDQTRKDSLNERKGKKTSRKTDGLQT